MELHENCMTSIFGHSGKTHAQKAKIFKAKCSDMFGARFPSNLVMLAPKAPLEKIHTLADSW